MCRLFFFFVIKFLNKEQITLLLVVIRVGTYYKLSDGEQWYKRQNKTWVYREDSGTFSVKVQFYNTRRDIESESNYLSLTDIKARRYRE